MKKESAKLCGWGGERVCMGDMVQILLQVVWVRWVHEIVALLEKLAWIKVNILYVPFVLTVL